MQNIICKVKDAEETYPKILAKNSNILFFTAASIYIL